MAAPGAGFGSDRLPRHSHTVCLGVNHGNPIRRRPAARGRLACLPVPAWPVASAKPMSPGARASPGQGPPPPRPSPRLMAIPPPSPARNRSNRAGPAHRVRSPPPPPTLSLRSARNRRPLVGGGADPGPAQAEPAAPRWLSTQNAAAAAGQTGRFPAHPRKGRQWGGGSLIGRRRRHRMTPKQTVWPPVLAAGARKAAPGGAAWPAGGEIQPKTAWRRHR
jgi:hypothetical protein